MRSIPVRLWFTALAALATSSTLVPSLRAQDPATPTLHLVPRFGYTDVLRGGEYGSLFLDGASALMVELDDGGSIGLALDMALPFDWMEFRLTADRSIGMELVRPEVTTVTRDGEPLALGIIRPGQSIDTGVGVRRWSLGGDLLLFPAPAGWAVRPFASVGAAFHWNRFDDVGDQPGDVQLSLFRDGTDGSFRFGTGIDVRVRRWIVRAGLSLLQGGEDRRQEAHYTVGLRVPLR